MKPVRDMRARSTKHEVEREKAARSAIQAVKHGGPPGVADYVKFLEDQVTRSGLVRDLLRDCPAVNKAGFERYLLASYDAGSDRGEGSS